MRLPGYFCFRRQAEYAPDTPAPTTAMSTSSSALSLSKGSNASCTRRAIGSPCSSGTRPFCTSREAGGQGPPGHECPGYQGKKPDESGSIQVSTLEPGLPGFLVS